MIIFEKCTVEDGVLDLDGVKHRFVAGKHCLWVPSLRGKIVWSHNGHIASYKDWELGRTAGEIFYGKLNTAINCRPYEIETMKSIYSEYVAIKMLAEQGLAPRVGGMFFIKNLISEFPYGVLHCDSRGRFGYFFEDANEYDPVEFSIEKVKEVLNKDEFFFVENTFNDIRKEKNRVNGLVIDVRRSMAQNFMLNRLEDTSIREKELEPMFEAYHDGFGKGEDGFPELKKKIQDLTQFPHMQRKQNYQTYFLHGKYHTGSRNTQERFDVMQIESDLTNKTVVDLGCNLGSVCTETYLRGARKITGIDYEQDYVDCARDLARANRFSINFVQMDLKKTAEAIRYFNEYYVQPIDILFMLSVYKHIKGATWELLKGIDWKVCYLESHNAPDVFECGHVKDMVAGMEGLHLKEVEYFGQTHDRSPRCIWKLQK